MFSLNDIQVTILSCSVSTVVVNDLSEASFVSFQGFEAADSNLQNACLINKMSFMFY